MTEQERMARGLWYDANNDPALDAQRNEADALCFEFNGTSPADAARREELLARIVPDLGAGAVVLAPFQVDYGRNCHIGESSFINHGAYFMDGASITLGKHCYVGPSCGFYTACHPLRHEERNRGLERALPITVGDNVWFGASVTVLPGVTIGDGAVIGAGSVVTKDIPAGVVAAGNPCRVIRPITAEDAIEYEEE